MYRAVLLVICFVDASEKTDTNIHMPNLGRGLVIGSLYDARSEKAVSGFLWPPDVLRTIG